MQNRRYIPPNKRTSAAHTPISSLPSSYFPPLSTSPTSPASPVSPAKSSLSFTDCFKVVPVSEQDAVKELTARKRAQMIEDGWVFLSLDIANIPDYIQTWNHNCVTKFTEFDSYLPRIQEDSALVDDDDCSVYQDSPPYHSDISEEDYYTD